MKKVLFTTLSIIAVAAMMLVSCKKDEPKPDNKDPETPTEEVDPELVGTWTIVGQAQGWAADGGVAMTENNNVWTVAEVAVKGEGFKFVKDGSWDINLGAADNADAKEDNVEFDLEKNGKNIKGAKDGVYSVTLNLLTKKAKIAFVKDLEPEFPEDTWDYTPSEAYAAETNLWKAIDAAGATHYYYYLNPGWAETPIHGDTESDEYPYLTKTQSTYRLAYTKATTERRQCQFFMMPKEANAIALDPNKKYNFKMTLGASTPLNCFFKLLTYGPNGPKHEGAAIWEPEGYPDNVKLTEAFAPVVLEHEISGIEASNLNLVFDFGTSPANVYIYIKDIIIEEVAPSVSEFIALEDNTESTFEAIVAAVVPNKGIIVTDGAKNLYVFGPKTYPVVGDKVSIKATKTTYYGLIETKSGAEVTVLSQGNTVPSTTPVDVTATFDAFPDTMSTSEIVTVVGTIAVSGNFVNFNVNGATKRQGSAAVMDLNSYDGKTMAITGYYYGTSGTGGKFVNIAVTKAEVFEPTIDGNYDDWAYFAGNTTGPNSKGHTTTMKAVASGSTVYVYLKVETAEANAANHVIDDESYVYFSFDKDNDSTTGSTDWYRTGADNPDNPKYRVKFGSNGLREGLAEEAAAASVKCVDDATNRVLQMELKFDKAALGTATALSEVGMKIFALGYIPGEFTGNVALTF